MLPLEMKGKKQINCSKPGVQQGPELQDKLNDLGYSDVAKDVKVKANQELSRKFSLISH